MILLNAAVMPHEGIFQLDKCPLDEFWHRLTRAHTSGELRSFIGYQNTLDLIEHFTGIRLAVNVEQTTMTDGDEFLVRRLRRRVSPQAKVRTLGHDAPLAIVKQAEEKYTKASESFEPLSEEQLHQRLNELREIVAYRIADKNSQQRKYHDLDKRIQWETAQLELLTDPVEREGVQTTIKGMRQQLTSLKDHSALDRAIITAVGELLEICKELVRRGIPVPVDSFFL